MKSIRLNKDIRTQIVANIKKAYLNNNTRPEVNDSRETDLNEVILKHYNSKYKEAFAAYEDPKLKPFINYSNYFCIRNDTGALTYIYFGNDEKGNTIHRPTPKNSGAFIDLSNPDTKIPASIQKVIDANKKIKKQCRKEREEQSKYDLELSKYLSEIRQVLDGVNTSKQLLEVWPEVQKFLPEGINNPSKINLPAISIASLNNKLGNP